MIVGGIPILSLPWAALLLCPRKGMHLLPALSCACWVSRIGQMEMAALGSGRGDDEGERHGYFIDHCKKQRFIGKDSLLHRVICLFIYWVGAQACAHYCALCTWPHEKDTSFLATNGEVEVNKLVAKYNANTRGWTLLEYGVVSLSMNCFESELLVLGSRLFWCVWETVLTLSVYTVYSRRQGFLG